MKEFTLQTDYLPILERLSDEAKGRLLHAAMVYADTGTKPLIVNIKERDKDVFNTLFGLICSRIEREAYKRADVSEARRMAGKASGKSRANKKRNTNE